MRSRAPTLACALIAAAVSAAATPAALAQGRSLAIGALKGPTGIGMIRLFESPPILPDGSRLAPAAVGSADVMAAKIISGEYEIAVLPVNMAAKLYSAGIQIRLAATVGDGMVSFLTSDPGIAALGDLRGREVAVAGQGATPDFLFRKLLSDAGLEPGRDLRLSYSLPYPEAAAALAAGTISCAVLPEPFATLALSANPGLRVPIDLGALWTKATGQASYPMSALVVSARLAAERPAAVGAILEACRSSIAWVRSNPREAGALVERHDLGLKAAIAERAIPRSNFAFQPAAEARARVESLLAVFLKSAPASIGGKLPDAEFYLGSR